MEEKEQDMNSVLLLKRYCIKVVLYVTWYEGNQQHETIQKKTTRLSGFMFNIYSKGVSLFMAGNYK